MRGRNRKGPNPMSRSYESNGPDVKVRGTAATIAEKYVQLARDAQSSGDPVAAENYFQHAEHYYRILAAAQTQFQPPQGFSRSDDERDEFDREDGDEDGEGQEAPAFGERNWEPRQDGGQQGRYENGNQPYEQRFDENGRYEGGGGQQPQGRYDNRGRNDGGRDNNNRQQRFDNNRPRYDDRQRQDNRGGDGRGGEGRDNRNGERYDNRNRGEDNRSYRGGEDNRFSRGGGDDNRSFRGEDRGGERNNGPRSDERADRGSNNGYRGDDRGERQDSGERPERAERQASDRPERNERPERPARAPRNVEQPRAEVNGNGAHPADWEAPETALPAFITSPVPIAASPPVEESEEPAAEAAPAARAPRRRRYTRRTPEAQAEGGEPSPSEAPVE
jgi:hypothetical protein